MSKGVSQLVATILIAAAAGVLAAVFASTFLPMIPWLAPYEPRVSVSVVSASYSGNVIVLTLVVQLQSYAHGRVYLDTVYGSYVVSGSVQQLTPLSGCGSLTQEICSGPLAGSTQIFSVALAAPSQIQPGGEGTVVLRFGYGSGYFTASATFRL
ncbi:MAG: hypothetical protein QXX83_08760 [Thermofilum sp.]